MFFISLRVGAPEGCWAFWPKFALHYVLLVYIHQQTNDWTSQEIDLLQGQDEPHTAFKLFNSFKFYFSVSLAAGRIPL